jgi:teichuronic acid biosynthesis glycosyltransferase TuaC
VTRSVEHKRVVVTFHGSDLLGEHAAGYVRKLIAGYGVWASWRAARRAHGVVTVSKVLQEALPKDIDRRKTRIIPCGIDLNRFTPLDQQACRTRLGWDPRRFHVLFPSHAGNPVKRSELARRAIERLNHSGIEAELHYLADVSNAEVPVWLNASDVLLLTSFHEGSPTIVKEALACDRPVVSVDVGDVRERIEEVPGCHIGTPDPESLAAKLRIVHAGPGRVEGRVRILDLSLQSVAVRLRNFYNELLSVGEEAAPVRAAAPVA